MENKFVGDRSGGLSDLLRFKTEKLLIIILLVILQRRRPGRGIEEGKHGLVH